MESLVRRLISPSVEADLFVLVEVLLEAICLFCAHSFLSGVHFLGWLCDCRRLCGTIHVFYAVLCSAHLRAVLWRRYGRCLHYLVAVICSWALSQEAPLLTVSSCSDLCSTTVWEVPFGAYWYGVH